MFYHAYINVYEFHNHKYVTQKFIIITKSWRNIAKDIEGGLQTVNKMMWMKLNIVYKEHKGTLHGYIVILVL